MGPLVLGKPYSLRLLLLNVEFTFSGIHMYMYVHVHDNIIIWWHLVFIIRICMYMCILYMLANIIVQCL